MIKPLVLGDAEELLELHLSIHSFQGRAKKSSFYRMADYQQQSHDFVDFFKSTVGDPDYMYLGAFADTGELLSFIKFNKWTHTSGRLSVTLGSMMSTNKVVLPKSHGGKFWNDTLIDILNQATLKYEDEGVVDWYTLRPIYHPDWVPVTSMKDVRLSTYGSGIVEELGFGVSKDPQYRKYVCGMYFTTKQGLFRLTKPGS